VHSERLLVYFTVLSNFPITAVTESFFVPHVHAGVRQNPCDKPPLYKVKFGIAFNSSDSDSSVGPYTYTKDVTGLRYLCVS